MTDVTQLVPDEVCNLAFAAKKALAVLQKMDPVPSEAAMLADALAEYGEEIVVPQSPLRCPECGSTDFHGPTSSDWQAVCVQCGSVLP